jgi:SNF2 family DNA or RNA helicase
MNRIDQFTWVEKPDAEKIVADMLRGTVTRFERKDCFDLPPTLPYTHEVEMTKEQRELTKELRRESMAEVEAGLIKGPNEAVIINKFLQIFSGAVKAIDSEGREQIQKVDCAPKLQALDELIEGSSGPVIVAAEFIGAIARIAEHAERKKIAYRVVIGNTKPEDRRHIFDDLQADKYKLLIAHPKTVAHGLTLTTSNVILWWSPIYSNEMTEQFNGRITRPGQERNTYIVNFICSALERKVLRKVGEKGKRQSILMEYLEGNND